MTNIEASGKHLQYSINAELCSKQTRLLGQELNNNILEKNAKEGHQQLLGLWLFIAQSPVAWPGYK